MTQWQFTEQPTWEALPCENSSFSRVISDMKLSSDFKNTNGLCARVLARIIDIVEKFRGLKRLYTNSKLNFDNTKAIDNQHQYPCALGSANTARGELFHRITLEQEIISDYRILAPTEWNFHPLGVVEKSLSKLRGPIDTIRQKAALFIELLDPCVAYQLLDHQLDR